MHVSKHITTHLGHLGESYQAWKNDIFWVFRSTTWQSDYLYLMSSFSILLTHRLSNSLSLVFFLNFLWNKMYKRQVTTPNIWFLNNPNHHLCARQMYGICQFSHYKCLVVYVMYLNLLYILLYWVILRLFLVTYCSLYWLLNYFFTKNKTFSLIYLHMIVVNI